jgi:alkylation response protein AidB-like acyl-CoA dehydrogenase
MSDYKTIVETAARHAADVDGKGRFPVEAIDALRPHFGLCVTADLGGKGKGFAEFAALVEELAGACASTAMVYVMHVTAGQAIAASTTFSRKDEILRLMAGGKHLTTLAFSEKGSRSHFWAPMSKLTEDKGGYTTNAFKSWVTSAHHADSYVSSAQKPGAASPLESMVYFIGRTSPGVRVTSGFDGLGLRGNDSAPVSIEDAKISKGDIIGPDGAKTMLEVVLPWFAVGTAAMAHGLCKAAIGATVGHLQNSKLEHSGEALRDLPVLRARIAEMFVATEASRALLARTMAAPEPAGILSSRMSALQTAVTVTDLAMRACGGAAFSRQLGVERSFRDARAGWVMAPTVDHLADFLGKALTGLPLF